MPDYNQLIVASHYHPTSPIVPVRAVDLNTAIAMMGKKWGMSVQETQAYLLQSQLDMFDPDKEHELLADMPPDYSLKPIEQRRDDIVKVASTHRVLPGPQIEWADFVGNSSVFKEFMGRLHQNDATVSQTVIQATAAGIVIDYLGGFAPRTKDGILNYHDLCDLNTIGSSDDPRLLPQQPVSIETNLYTWDFQEKLNAFVSARYTNEQLLRDPQAALDAFLAQENTGVNPDDALLSQVRAIYSSYHGFTTNNIAAFIEEEGRQASYQHIDMQQELQYVNKIRALAPSIDPVVAEPHFTRVTLATIINNRKIEIRAA